MLVINYVSIFLILFFLGLFRWIMMDHDLRRLVKAKHVVIIISKKIRMIRTNLFLPVLNPIPDHIKDRTNCL